MKRKRQGNERFPSKRKPIPVEVRSTANLPKAVEPSKSDPKYSSWSHLEHLYRITKLLVKFENIERTVGAILGIVSDTLPLRSAILIEGSAGHPQVSVWNGEGLSKKDLLAARNRAAASYAYLTGSPASLEKDPAAANNFIVIPLVVDRRPIFGVFQLECTAKCNEADLMFVNAIANQLAIALDRDKAWQHEMAARSEAEAGERRMRFLADASRLLSASFDYRSAWENVARLAIPDIADYCFIDILEDQKLRRIVLLSPEHTPDTAEQGLDVVLRAVVRQVFETRRPLMQQAEDKGRRFESYMCVPLCINDHALGTLTLVSTHPTHIYKQNDLILLEDLARRAVVAFENAQLYADALQATRSRDDVLHAVSHDLKGPLAIVHGFVSIFLEKAKADESLTCDRQQVEAIQRQTRHMNALIDDLLDTAKIEARHLYVEREACPVVSLVNEAMDLPRALAVSKGIELTSQVPSGLSSVSVDRRRILQVFANLIGNAIKFTPAGGTITVRAEEFENDIQFSVEDTGPGIKEEEIPHLFDRFWQAKKTARLGTGLGLFIVKGIVEGHGGRVWVESRPGAGSRFYFTLPTEKR